MGCAAFLLAYAVLAVLRAFKPHTMEAAQTKIASFTTAVLTCLALTFLNPHVYIDTVILLGSVSVQYGDENRFAFGLGAVLASFVWFFALGYGARLLEPLFAKPIAWRILDFAIAGIMTAIAVSLLIS